jgi:glycosyl transferase family 25
MTIILILIFLFIIMLNFLIIQKQTTTNIDKYTDLNFLHKIDKIYYINLEHRSDRKEQFLSNFKKEDYNRIERIDAIKTPENGAIGCLMSHIKALEKAQQDNQNIVLVAEDDFQILNIEKTNKVIDYIVKNIPNWDVIMLAHNTIEFDNTNHNVSDTQIIKILNSQTASGYVVNKNYIEKLLNNYQNSYNKYKKDNIWKGEYCNDQCWKTLQKEDNWFSTLPRLGKQRKSFSDIQNSVVNYELFKQKQ